MISAGPAKLAIRPYPLPDEGARGYVQRLATVNGLQSVQVPNSRGNFISLDELKGLLGRDDSELWINHPELVYWDERSRRSSSTWYWKSRKFCPLCLKESRYWRVDWELKWMAVCVKHEVELVETCPKCLLPILWNTQVLAECKCGFELTQANATPCLENERALGKAIRASLGLADWPESLKNLEHFSLRQLIRLIDCLGALSDTHSSSPKQMFKHASEYLGEWPSKFRSALTKLQSERKSSDGVPSIRQTFGKLYTDLYSTANLDTLDFVRREFETYICDSWNWPLDSKSSCYPRSVRSRNWIPATQVSMELNIRYRRLTTLISEGNIESQIVVLPSGRKYLSIREADVKTIEQILTNKITLFQAAKMLGLSEKRVKSLIDAGVLQTDSEKQSSAERWEISRNSLLELLAKGEAAPELDEVGKEHLLLRNLAKSGLRTSSVLPALIGEIVSGRIEVEARLRNVPGISGWTIAAGKYGCWKKAQVELAEDYYSIQETAEVLQVKQSVAYDLAKHGLLKTDIINRNGFSSAIVTKSNIDQFRSQYVFGRDLASELGTSPRKIIQLFDEMDVHPTPALQKVAKPQAVFEKTSELMQCWNAVLERKLTMKK